jgi:excisionase family DNA binding protein
MAVSIAEAAELLGVSADHFRRHVLPDLRVVRSGRLRLVSIAELRDWLDRSAARALDGAPLAHGSANPHGNRPPGGAQGDAPRVVSSPSKVAARPSWQDDDRRDEFS